MSKLPILLILLLLLLLGFGGNGRGSRRVANVPPSTQAGQESNPGSVPGAIPQPGPNPAPNPVPVPTPALLPGLVIFLGGVLRKQRHQQVQAIHQFDGEKTPPEIGF